MNHMPPFRQAIAALAEGHAAAALPLLCLCIENGEEVELAQLNLGMALIDLGRPSEAAPHLAAAASALPDLAEPRFRLGQIAAQRHDHATARAEFNAALARDPTHVMSLVGLAALEEQAGRPDLALHLLDTALLLAPQDAAIRTLRIGMAGQDALAALDAGGVAAARLAAERVSLPRLRDGLATSANPWPWHAAIGLALLAEGDEPAGLAALRIAALLSGDAPEMLGELALRLAEARRHAEALPLLEQALAARPWDVALRTQRGASLFKLHRLAEARAALQSAISDLGPHLALTGNLALVLNAQGLQREALACWADAGDSQAVCYGRLGVQPYHPELGSGAALHATAAALGRHLPAPLPLHHTPGFDPARRLRVGLLSAAFGRHPVGWLTLAGIEALPRDQFEIACFSLRRLDDPLARRFHATAEHWHDLPRLDDRELVAAIRAEQPDILIDLGGHGEGGRAAALARRAAPVQIKWVGAQSCTTGIPAMDWMLTDRFETPPGSEPLYTEALLRLPDGYVCYTPPPWAPAIGPLPAQANGHITFGCFNNLAKITPEVLVTWAAILAAAPASRLVLRTHALADAATREAFARHAAAHGIDPARLSLLGPAPHAELLAGYNDIDIALDPFPYAGGLTAIEALYMGVPLVAMAGTSFAGRHAVSHLHNTGLADWVAQDSTAYIQRAIAAAQDTARLAQLRAALRARLAASPLMDAPRFGRALADALRAAWTLRCQAQSGRGNVM